MFNLKTRIPKQTSHRYILRRDNIAELSEYWQSFVALSCKWFPNIQWDEKILTTPLRKYETLADICRHQRRLRLRSLPHQFHSTFSRLVREYAVSLATTCTYEDAVSEFLSRVEFHGRVDSILSHKANEIYQILAMLRDFEDASSSVVNGAFDIVVRDLLLDRKGVPIDVKDKAQCESLLRAYLRGGIQVEGGFAKLDSSTRSILFSSKVPDTRLYVVCF